MTMRSLKMTVAGLWIALGAFLWIAVGGFGEAAPVPASDGTGQSAEASYPGGGSGWVVEDLEGGYQDVYYDPDAGPWIKTLGAPGGTAVAGGIYQLVEFLHVSAGPDGQAPAWTDYHEEIVGSPGWSWAPAGPSGEPWGFTNTNGSAMWYAIPAGNTIVDWGFAPPLPPCTNIQLTKWLQYNGGGDPTAPITVAEYPTIPEPGAVILLAIACAFAAGFRRKPRM